MTETELVLMSLTNEELDEAAEWNGRVLAQWRRSRERIEREGQQAAQPDDYRTDAPSHLSRAMDLAIVRERAQRGGAEPWYAGMPTDGHPAARAIRHYQERLTLNPDEGHRPRLSAAGILEKVCIGCGQAKPLTVALWPWLGGMLDDFCRSCRHPISPSAEAAAIRRALVDSEDDAQGQPAPLEPFILDQETDLPDPDPMLTL